LVYCNSPWDFGENLGCDKAGETEDSGAWVNLEPKTSARDHQATVEHCTDDEAEGL
jgi:hypothetical protein